MSLFFHHASPANHLASSAQGKTDSSAATPVSRRLLLWLTWGTAGTALFPIIYLLEGATRPGYDAWGQTISALSLGPGGWIQQINFALCGLSVLWSAYVWRKMLAGGTCAIWYPIIRGIEGMGLLAIAIFSTDPGYGYPPGTPSGAGPSTFGGTLHLTFTILVVNAMTIALLVIARRFWKQSLWRGWITFSIIMGFWPMVFMPFFVVAQNTHGLFTGYAGLFERLATNADTIWSLALVARLWVRRSAGF